MTDPSLKLPPFKSLFDIDAHTKARHRAERRFRAYGFAAVSIGIIGLFCLLFSVVGQGAGAFQQTFVTFDVYLDPAQLDKGGHGNVKDLEKLTIIAYGKFLNKSFQSALEKQGISPDGMSEKEILRFFSSQAPAQLRNMVLDDPSLLGKTIVFQTYSNAKVDAYFIGRITEESLKRDPVLTPAELKLAKDLSAIGMIDTKFNWGFLTYPDASELRPEVSGLAVALIGSAYMMVIVVALALPIGVGASIYLEEFAPKNRFTDLIEVNIANLAAVPSIVFGILGLAIFINLAHLPQSASLVGGLVLTLMTLPTIIISTRAALKAVPPSLRDAALGVGASPIQAIFHHILPQAMPGILTGTIIGLAHALGETAPLLLIGMVAFVRDFPSAPPEGLLDPASALPVQIYQWSQRADPAFVERASGAILVLLAFLLVMNGLAIILRRRFERRW